MVCNSDYTGMLNYRLTVATLLASCSDVILISTWKRKFHQFDVAKQNSKVSFKSGLTKSTCKQELSLLQILNTLKSPKKT